jgi:acyl-CoA synthetase (AMP-forming)/AMP-acid ligase II
MEIVERSLDEMATDVLANGGAEPAILFHGVWLDWNWLRSVADQVEALLCDAGLGAQDVVGFAPRNRPECAAALLGLIAARRDIVMIYAYQSPEAIGRKLAELRCSAIIGAADMWAEAARAAAQSIGALGISLEDATVQRVQGTTFDRTVEHRAANAEPGIALLTSGTTGAPKHFHMNYATVRRAMVMESMGAQRGDEPGPPMLHHAPFGNIAGVYGYLPRALTRRPIVMLEKFSIDHWLDYVRTWRPASSSMPPAGFRMLLDINPPPEDLRSIRHMATGAATLDPGVHREFEQRYGIPILLSYGATELGGVVSSMTPQDHERFGGEKFGSVGRPWSGAQLRIVDPDTAAVLAPGCEGVIEVLAPRMGSAWIRTTDLGVLDEDGFLYHRGRRDGAIMRGGFKIVPEVVMAALAEHPAIAAAAVVGVPHRRLGETPVAAYELRSGAVNPSEDALRSHMRARLPATHLPVLYREVPALPRTASLKLDVAGVRALFEGYRDIEVGRKTSPAD